MLLTVTMTPVLVALPTPLHLLSGIQLFHEFGVFIIDVFRVERSSQKKPGTVWPTSPAPPRVQRVSTSAPMVSPALFCADIQEISRKARNISQSSNVDWSKLP